MTYPEAVSFLFEAFPVFHISGKDAYKPGLRNIQLLMQHLDNPHKGFKIIHVAGTNGKGSVSHSLAAILQISGYKTALFTSPHLVSFTERIRVNGVPASEDFISNFITVHKSFLLELKPSFFEISVAMAFLYFQACGVEWAVIETGLGGRLDASNVVIPEISVITSIGLDHTDLLGNTLEQIAFEKAGIIKPNKPVVVGEMDKNSLSVIEKIAGEKNSHCFYAPNHFRILNCKVFDLYQEIQLENIVNSQKFLYRLDLLGSYQLKNILTVLTTIQLCQNVASINNHNISEALMQVCNLTGLKGRWQLLSKNPVVICDIGHNEQGMRENLKQLLSMNFSRLHIVLGFAKDKDVNSILSMMPKQAIYYFTAAQSIRAMNPNTLYQLAKHFQLEGSVFHEAKDAISHARKNADPSDVIFIGGSAYLVGELLADSIF